MSLQNVRLTTNVLCVVTSYSPVQRLSISFFEPQHHVYSIITISWRDVAWHHRFLAKNSLHVHDGNCNRDNKPILREILVVDNKPKRLTCFIFLMTWVSVVRHFYVSTEEYATLCWPSHPQCYQLPVSHSYHKIFRYHDFVTESTEAKQ